MHSSSRHIIIRVWIAIAADKRLQVRLLPSLAPLPPSCPKSRLKLTFSPSLPPSLPPVGSKERPGALSKLYGIVARPRIWWAPTSSLTPPSLPPSLRFERAARRALKALWDRRSPINLVGSNIHTATGKWTQMHSGTSSLPPSLAGIHSYKPSLPPSLPPSFPPSGIGAGIDFLYEYLLKAYVMSGDEELLQLLTHPPSLPPSLPSLRHWRGHRLLLRISAEGLRHVWRRGAARLV